jgi:aliphatic sulfonates family ABC transporter substrate-binding protein
MKTTKADGSAEIPSHLMGEGRGEGELSGNSIVYNPLPLIPFRKGRRKIALYEFIKSKTSSSIRIYSAALVLMIILMAAASGLADDQTDVRIAYVQKIHYAPTIIAVKQGYFEAEGIKVKPVILAAGTGIVAAEALISGSADAAVMGDAPAIYAIASGKPLKIVACYGGGEKMHRIIAGKDSGIRKAQDLTGKTIAVNFGSSTHGALMLYLKKNGLDLSQVKIMNLNSSDMPEALATGQIDAVAGSEPIPSTVEMGAPESYELTTLSGLGNSYPLVLVVSTELAADNPRAVSALVRATAKAVRLMNEEPQRAAEIIAGATGATPQFELKVMQALEWRVRLDQEVRDSLEQTRDFLFDIKKIPVKPDLDKFFDERFLR